MSTKGRPKIGRTLSKRHYGSIHESKIKNKKYVTKIEYVTQKEREDENSACWNEIKFSLQFGNKYPGQFMQLVNYYFDDCTRVEPIWSKTPSELRARVESNVCVHKTYTRMDAVLEEKLPTMTAAQIYSMLLQVSYALRLMHKAGYVHGDADNPGNIGMMKTTTKVIKLGEHAIPTHGYRFILIDFGRTLHIGDINDYFYGKKEAKRVIADETDERTYLGLFPFLCTRVQTTTTSDFSIQIKKMKSTPEFGVIQELSPNNKSAQALFYEAFYPEKYIQLFGGGVRAQARLPLPDLFYFARFGITSKETFAFLLSKLKLK